MVWRLQEKEIYDEPKMIQEDIAKMPELDSEEQELNCKIVVGKVRISNVDDFLSLLQNIAHKYAVTIQAMDAELIAGSEHIISAVKKAIRAYEEALKIYTVEK